MAFGGDGAVHGIACTVDAEFGGNACQGDWVAEWNQFPRAFGCLDGGNSGNTEHIAFFGRAGADECQGLWLHENRAGSAGEAGGFCLFANINHVGLAGGIEMGKFRVSHGYECLLCAPKAGVGLRYHSTMPFTRRLIALSLAAMLATQTLAQSFELPELGDVASNELSPVMEKKIGWQFMNDIRWREPSYLDDPDVESYLNQIGGRLAAVSNDPGLGYTFFAISDPSINAFAMPGGFIGVHTGLILAAQSESELAGVLAHEISHVTQRHIARQVFQSKQMSMASMAAMLLALLAARSNGQVAGAAIATSQAGVMSSQLAFSRDFEREADRLGFETLRKAGFDPRGMALFFERLQKAVRLYENNATAYLRTHPLTGERLGDMQNREQGLAYKQVVDSVDFQLVRAKLRALEGIPAEAVRDFEGLIRERKFVVEGPARFGLAYARYRARDWVGAERELEAARRLKVLSPMLEHLRADVRLAQGDTNGGLTIYRDAMVRYPLNLGLVYGYGTALIAARRFEDARRFAETQLQNYADDVRLYKMRAESYAGLGKRALQHQSLAEVFALQGQTQGAVEQLQLALRAGDASFYEMSVIDARLAELRRRFREEQKERRNGW